MSTSPLRRKATTAVSKLTRFIGFLSVFETAEARDTLRATLDDHYNSVWLDQLLREHFGPARSQTSGREFVQCVCGLTETPADLPPQFVEPLLPAIATLLNIIYDKNVAYKQQVFSNLRAHLTQHGWESKQLSALHITRDEFQTIQKDNREARDARNRNCIVVKTRDIRRLIREGMDVYASNDARAAALLLASGCRPVELYERATFKPAPETAKRVIQMGVAKKRLANGDAPVSFESPLLYCNFQEFATALYLLERGHSLDGFKNKVNNYFKQCGLRYTCSTARAIYGNLSYIERPRGVNISLNEWLKQVLCHENSETSLSYTDIIIDSRSDSESPTHATAFAVRPVAVAFKVDDDSLVFPNGVCVERASKDVKGSKKRRDLARAKITELETLAIKPTHRILRALGFSAELIKSVFGEMGIKA